MGAATVSSFRPPDADRPLVLTVDDDPGLVQLIGRRLRGAGLRTAGATTGRAALETLGRSAVDLLLIDFRLPDMLADELVARLREAGHDLPFIVITGYGDERTAVEMMKRGARDYLRKDATLLDLLPAVVTRTLEQLERERRADANEEALRLLYSAVHQANDAVLVTTADLAAPGPTIVLANPGFHRLTGYDEKDVRGRSPRMLQGAGTDREALASMRRALDAGQAWSGELLNYRRDGTAYLVELNVAPVRDESGRVTHFVAIERDVTERARHEEQVRQSAKLEAVGSLASGIAHDFNNMLAVIRGHAELLLDVVPPGSPIVESVDAIRSAGEHASALTRQLLSFSRRSALQPERIDLADLVGRTVHLLARLLGEKIEVAVETDEAASSIRADRHQLEQVVLNLAVNARDAMPQGGRLTFRIEDIRLAEADGGRFVGVRPGHYVCLGVADTGVGMDAETRKRIFEPFFTTKTLGKGTGLGLATVYGIVTQSGGEIRVESEPGRGTRFDLLFPAEPHLLAAASPGPGAVARPRGNECVLVAEDEPLVRDLVVRCLEEAGYCVVAAPDGRAALGVDPPPAGRFDALVTDVAMPNLPGDELARRLRERHAGLRVLFLSAHTGSVEGLTDAPGSAFLAKPFDPVALLAKLRELLDAQV